MSSRIQIVGNHNIQILTLDGVSSTETNNRIAESAEQDQTARMCSLILLYTLR